MAKANAILQGNDDDADIVARSMAASSKPAISTLSSAGGQPISVSEESMAKANAILQDKGDDTVRRAMPLSAMSSSAGGQPIHITEESISKANAILQDNSDELAAAAPSNPSIAMFNSASGKPIVISEESMAKANEMLQRSGEDVIQTASSSKSPNAMFTSVDGKCIVMSEERAAETQEALHEDLVSNGALFSASCENPLVAPRESTPPMFCDNNVGIYTSPQSHDRSSNPRQMSGNSYHDEDGTHIEIKDIPERPFLLGVDPARDKTCK
jgi:hypothetical protein